MICHLFSCFLVGEAVEDIWLTVDDLLDILLFQLVCLALVVDFVHADVENAFLPIDVMGVAQHLEDIHWRDQILLQVNVLQETNY